MKKIVLSFILVLLFCSASFACNAGNFGITAAQMLYGDPIGIMGNSKHVSFFYHFTDLFNAEIGVVLGNFVNIPAQEDSYTENGIRAAAYWEFGRSVVIPRIGVEAVSTNVNGKVSASDISVSDLDLILTYGMEVKAFEMLHFCFDVRLIEYQSVDGENGGVDILAHNLTILSGYTFGVRWYII